MLIELKTKNKDGSVLFQGMLSPDEVNFVFNVGINALMNAGHLPFKKLDTETSIILPEKITVQ